VREETAETGGADDVNSVEQIFEPPQGDHAMQPATRDEQAEQGRDLTGFI
jgi:hypothetical protein